MATLLDYAALIQDDEAVGVAEGGKAVGNGDGRAAPRQMAHRLLNLLLRLYVDRGGRLV